MFFLERRQRGTKHPRWNYIQQIPTRFAIEMKIPRM
jgi:hypothetical protein